MLVDFAEISVEAICPTVSHSFQGTKHQKWDHMTDVLMVQFKGIYREGSGGNPDANYINAIIDFGLEMFSPNRLIVDLRELTYTFGNSIYNVLNKIRKHTTAVLVGDASRAALTSLWQFLGHKNEDITQIKGFFDDLTAAYKYVADQKPWFERETS